MLKDRPAPGGSGMLALGDPIFNVRKKEERPLPPGGLLVIGTAPGGNAAKAGLQADDVLLKYAGVELASLEALGKAIQGHANDQSIELTVWRDGKTNIRDVPPGRLGVILAKDPAPQALAERRKTDALLLDTRGTDQDELPGTRVEVNNLALLFAKQATILVDSDASEQKLEELRVAGASEEFPLPPLRHPRRGQQCHVI